MITAIGFVVLAGCGTLARASIGRRLNRPGFATGTLLINGSGSLALGLLHGVAPPLATVLGTGLLGAFTTFSSFSRDAVALVEQGRHARAALYVVATCAVAVTGAWLGLVIAG